MAFKTAGLIVAFAVGLLSTPAGAQPPAKVARVGYLSVSPPATPFWETFAQGLRELGYVEGQNLVIERRHAGGNSELFPELAAKLVRLGVDVIVAVGTPATRAARDATAAIPIVMVGVGEPVESGLVSGLARPGGNVTGLGGFGPELEAKRLEVLKEALPKISRVAALFTPAPGVHTPHLKETEVAARALGVKLQPIAVRGSNDFARVFAEMTRAGTEAFLAFRDPLIIGQRRQLVELAVKSRMPAMYPFKEIVSAGGLIFYGEDLVQACRRATAFVDKILKGAKPADLPVEQPTKFELVINLKTARALGLTIPQSVLIRADQVIQ